MKKNDKLNVVGKSVRKVDGIALATGKAKFVDDIDLPDMLYAKVLRSPYAHALIEKIDTSAAEKLEGVEAVITYKDVPRIIHTTAGQNYPEPSPYDTFIIDKKVRFVGDRVAAVAAKTEEIAEKALKLIKVKYKVLKPILDPEDSMKKGAPIIHDEKEAYSILPIHYEPKKNIAGHVDMEIGNVNNALKKSDYVFDNKFSTPYQSHAAIEPHITLSYLDENNRLIIYASTQVTFHIRRIVARSLGIPEGRVRVIKLRTGGGFGGKQEVFIEQLCAALTLKTKKPVKLFFTRKEVFPSSRTRHPQNIHLRTGVNKDGKITAIDLNILMNTGAYGSHAMTVVCNSGSKVLPLYKCNNVRFWGDTVYTNMPVGGAYRGYGATQAHFAIGVAADEMAEAIGLDTLDFLKMIHIKKGEGSPIFAVLGEGQEGVPQKIDACGLAECIELGSKSIGWKTKRKKYKKQSGRFRKGVGMVILMQGSSIPYIDMAGATIKLNDDGSFNLLVGATDLGTGSDTVLGQIAAEVLTVGMDKMIVYSSDTDITPFDVGAYASSTTYLSGMAVKTAAEKVKKQVLQVGAEILKDKNVKLINGYVIGKKGKISLKDIADYSLYQKNQFQIIGSASKTSEKSPPPFSAHFAEVEVDTLTGKIKLLKYVAAYECGRAINPALADGQTQGGVVNGIGQALYEEFIFNKNGSMLNTSFSTYKIPSSLDIPELKVIRVTDPEPTGPYGAKSVSEICINGPMPAISNAIYNACGIRLRHAPFTPEKVFNALKSKK